jgi:hypothetical protein
LQNSIQENPAHFSILHRDFSLSAFHSCRRLRYSGGGRQNALRASLKNFFKFNHPPAA